MYNPYPCRSEPFFGTWENPVGAGLKKRTQKKENGPINKSFGYSTKQNMEFNSRYRTNNVKFIDKPLSNYDLLNWVDYLGIKHFRGIFSRDNFAK